MRLKIIAYNAQDFFLNPAFEITQDTLQNLTEAQWQLLAPDGTRLKPLVQLRGLQQMIQEEEPDIIGLCEIGGLASLQNFNRWYLEERYEVLLIEGNDSRGIDNGFLVKKGLPLGHELLTHKDWVLAFSYPHEIDPAAFPIAVEAAAYRDLGKPDDRRLSRDVPALVLRNEKQETVLAILMVHLKSGLDTEGFDPGGQIRRAAEVKALLDIRDGLQKTLGPVPIMLAGDFNGNASREGTTFEFQPLYARTDLEDVLALVGRPRHERLTHFTFYGRQLMASQLDYIFVPKQLAPRLDQAATYVYRYRFADDQQEMMFPTSFEDRRKLPSDHYPVVCVLELP